MRVSSSSDSSAGTGVALQEHRGQHRVKIEGQAPGSRVAVPSRPEEGVSGRPSVSKCIPNHHTTQPLSTQHVTPHTSPIYPYLRLLVCLQPQLNGHLQKPLKLLSLKGCVRHVLVLVVLTLL